MQTKVGKQVQTKIKVEKANMYKHCLPASNFLLSLLIRSLIIAEKARKSVNRKKNNYSNVKIQKRN